jgi:hypothetical protein
MRGPSVVRDPHPLPSTGCQFGIWFNQEGQKLRQKFDLDSFSKIETLHNELHERFLTIYEIYFGSAEGIVYDPKAKLEKFKVSEELTSKAQNAFTELRERSYALIKELESLKKAIENSDKFS